MLSERTKARWQQMNKEHCDVIREMEHDEAYADAVDKALAGGVFLDDGTIRNADRIRRNVEERDGLAEES